MMLLVLALLTLLVLILVVILRITDLMVDQEALLREETPARTAPQGSEVVYLSGHALHAKGLGNGAVRVLPGGEIFSEYAVSPDGSRVAFVDGKHDLYAMDADGSGRMLLAGPSADPTETLTPGSAPAFSPDGRQIAFSSRIRGSGAVRLVDSHGSTRRSLPAAEGVEHLDPSWSPDGVSVAFIRDDGETREMHVTRVDGLAQRILEAGSAMPAHPAYSPDGSKIALTDYREDGPEIVVVDADGGAPVEVTKGPAGGEDPSFSPNGAKLLYASEGDLYVVNVDGTRGQRVTASPEDEGRPEWR